MSSPSDQPNNPLHGITLRAILEDLVNRRGFDELGRLIPIRCFTHEPSVSSSLKFLRKTEWARAKVESLYLKDQRALDKKRARNQARAERRRIAGSFAEPPSDTEDEGDQRTFVSRPSDA